MRKRMIGLSNEKIPTHWYNIMADMPNPPAPVLHPGTHQPVGPDDLSPLFAMELIGQEMSPDREIEIPEEVRDIYGTYRGTPMFRAYALEKALGTRSKIYYKYEGVSPAGSHKVNTALAQAYYNKKEGISRLTTETGAGQWGSALSYAGALFGIEVIVFMVKVSYNQKPYRRLLMETWGGKVIPSPSNQTEAGKAILAQDPNSPGSLGIAISEAVEQAVQREDTHYTLGSVLNHVLLHQTVIGQEAKTQMEEMGDYPDVVIGACGGGSNLAGLGFPFLRDKINGKEVRIQAVEPASCPTLTKGHYGYDFGDTAMMTPLTKMYTLGHTFVPPGIHAGGLRYHGDSPLVSQLHHEGLIEARAYHQLGIFESAVTFARTEGIVPAPESAHAIHGAVEEARKADAEGVERTILFGLSGHGHFDMAAYQDYFAGKLVDHEHSDADMQEALKHLPQVAE